MRKNKEIMKLLITGAWKGAKEYIAELERMGHIVCFMQQESGELPCPADGIEGIICSNLFAYHPIAQFHSLRYIQLTSAGYDRMPMEYIRTHGIGIHNAGDAYAAPMAETALCGVLQIYKKARTFAKQQRAHVWEKQRDLPELTGKTVGIIGCGAVGMACARRFSAFDARVIGVNRTAKESPFFEKILPMEQLDEVLPQCDIVVLAIALTEETKHLMNRYRLALLKSTAVLVNLARGGLIDTPVMEEYLMENRLSGAVLDAFEQEPLAVDSPLWDMENVILTPHNSFVGDGNSRRLWNVIKGNLEE